MAFDHFRAEPAPDTPAPTRAPVPTPAQVRLPHLTPGGVPRPSRTNPILTAVHQPNISIQAPNLPLFDTVEVRTAKANVLVKPFIVQAGIGVDFLLPRPSRSGSSCQQRRDGANVARHRDRSLGPLTPAFGASSAIPGRSCIDHQLPRQTTRYGHGCWLALAIAE
jgi:hypothetical protein